MFTWCTGEEGRKEGGEQGRRDGGEEGMREGRRKYNFSRTTGLLVTGFAVLVIVAPCRTAVGLNFVPLHCSAGLHPVRAVPAGGAVGHCQAHCRVQVHAYTGHVDDSRRTRIYPPKLSSVATSAPCTPLTPPPFRPLSATNCDLLTQLIECQM